MTKHTHSTSPATNPTIILIPQFRAVINGRVITPEDADYDEARAPSSTVQSTATRRSSSGLRTLPTSRTSSRSPERVGLSSP
jgi:hypothetical protein